MRTVTIKQDIYTYDELGQEAKDKVVNEWIIFLLETNAPELESGDYKRAIDKAESMQTPWFTGSYIYEYCLTDIEETIRLNEYQFLKDGSFYTPVK